MNWFYNVKIKNKFLIIFGSIILSIVIGLVLLHVSFEHIQVGGSYYKGISIKTETIDEIARTRMNINLIRSMIYSLYIFQDHSYSETISSTLKNNDKIILRLKKKVASSSNNCYSCHSPVDIKEIKTYINRSDTHWNNFKKLTLEFTTNSKSTPLLEQIEEEYINFMDSSKTPLDILRKVVPQQVDHLVMRSNRIRMLFVLFGALLTAFICYVAYILYKNIKTSVNDVFELSRRISKGDISNVKTKIHGKDEIGLMASSFEEMGRRLKTFIGDVKRGINELFSSSNTLSKYANDLFQSAGKQRKNADNILLATDEISRSIQIITQHTGNASEKTKESFELASAGFDLAQQAKDQIERIARVVQSSSELIENLGQKAKEIENIVYVIKEISEQTNLLALNAAIEAARAGEHGKGFAIVADEVRKLAEKTGSSTKEIAEKIKTIQTETLNSVNTIKESLDEVMKGTRIVDNVKEALSKIVDSASTVSDMVNQIAISTEQHLSSIEDITEHIHALTRDIETSTDISERLKNISSDLALLAKRLKDLSDYYRVSEPPHQVNNNLEDTQLSLSSKEHVKSMS